MIPLLLTATVDPQGMKGAAFDPKDRMMQYVEALRFYRNALPGHPIVLAENSGYAAEIAKSFTNDNLIELVDVSQADYRQDRGKGYNEVLLLHNAVLKSELVSKAGCFFKLTGRLKLLNVAKLLKECAGETFRADCKDHHVYEWLHMPINGHVGECRYWYATTDFFEQYMAPRYNELCDYGEEPMLAEDLMLDVCRKTRGQKGCRDRFRAQARISGKGGHDLGKGASFFYSTDNDSFALRFKCGLRQLIRWLMPFWRA